MKEVTIELTAAAVVVDGQIKRPGSIVTVAAPMAKNLLNRGKARAVGLSDHEGHAEDGMDDLSGLNMDTLRAMAEDAGIDGYQALKKAELIEALQGAGKQ